jgi:phenol 2-monooxygenase
MQLGHVVKADGRWRLFAFADKAAPDAANSRLAALCAYLAQAETAPPRRYTEVGADGDSLFDTRAVFQQDHRTLALQRMPAFLMPRKGRFGLIDYEKMFCAVQKTDQDIYELRGIDRQAGCLVIVRPDQYIGTVLPLDAFAEIEAYFAPFMSARR